MMAIFVSFNRTFMELKQDVATLAASMIFCFNRTFMELKRGYSIIGVNACRF